MFREKEITMFFDKETLNIKEDDILWRWYKKRFEIEQKQIEAPKNLCSYFWTSVRGLGLWIDREVSLTRLWMVTLSALLLFILSSFLVHATSPVVWIAGSVAAVVTFIALLLTMAASFNTSINRAFRRLHKNSKVEALAVFSFFGIIVVFMAQRGELVRFLKEIFAALPYALGLVVAIVLVLALYIVLPQRITGGVGKAVKTCIAFLSAKKQRFCPRVDPPASFQKNIKN